MDKIVMEQVYYISNDVVSREIEGELVIVPIVSGIGDMEDDLYSLNLTGKAVWKLIDGKLSLNNIVTILAERFDADSELLKNDVIDLINELVMRKLIIKSEI